MSNLPAKNRVRARAPENFPSIFLKGLRRKSSLCHRRECLCTAQTMRHMSEQLLAHHFVSMKAYDGCPLRNSRKRRKSGFIYRYTYSPRTLYVYYMRYCAVVYYTGFRILSQGQKRWQKTPYVIYMPCGTMGYSTEKSEKSHTILSPFSPAWAEFGQMGYSASNVRLTCFCPSAGILVPMWKCSNENEKPLYPLPSAYASRIHL